MTKTAAITGAASGIGQAACRRLLDTGWTVFGPDNARGRLDAVGDGARYVTGATIPVDGGTQAAFIPPSSPR
jgi:NAD(P)-dependent dehydrogenase (short-subunit alcohol dehydrogenase family)